MRLRIGEYEITEHTLSDVDFILGTYTVTFSGMAKENDAKEILAKLRQLSVETEALSYEDIDHMGVRSTGLCNLVNLRLEEVTTNPPMVVFSGELVHPAPRQRFLSLKTRARDNRLQMLRASR